MNKDEYIRVLASYLFSIKIDDKYLLVHSRRKNTFQPLGGCYKFFESAVPYLSSMGCLPADKDPYDLRLYVPAERINDFSEWLRSGKDRETTFDREFTEELFIENNYLDFSKFGYPKFEKYKNGYMNIKYDEFYGMLSAYPMDIVSVELSKEQEKLIKEMVANPESPFVFATEKDIAKGFVMKNDKKVRIGDHTKKIVVPEQKSLDA